MAIHIGKLVKQAIKMRGMKVSELARRINTSRENMYGIFRRQSIDTVLLQKLSTALDVNFFEHYQPNAIENSKLSEPLIPYKSKKSKTSSANTGSDIQMQLQVLQNEMAALKKELVLKDKIIALLERKNT